MLVTAFWLVTQTTLVAFAESNASAIPSGVAPRLRISNWSEAAAKSARTPRPTETIETLPPLVVPFRSPVEDSPRLSSQRVAQAQSTAPSIPTQTSTEADVRPRVTISFEVVPPESSRGWFGADFLLWAPSGDRLPPLVTASPQGTPRDQAGILGAPGTTILFGGERVNDEWRPGIRVRAGRWLNDDRTCGVETSFFYLDPAGTDAVFGPPGIVARPFFNTNGFPDSELVNYPGILNGAVRATADSTVWGGDLTALHKVEWNDRCFLAVASGYRFLRLSDTAGINENLTTTDPVGPFDPGTSLLVQDRFRTRNTFHGGFLGLRSEYESGRFILRTNASVALGCVHQTIDIAGVTVVAPPRLSAATFPGGLLALQSNNGRFQRDDFGVLPTVGVNLAYRLTRRIQLCGGYDFLYLNRVTRPGDVIDLTVNPALIPPATGGAPARPTVLDGHSDYWLHGLALGIQLQF